MLENLFSATRAQCHNLRIQKNAMLAILCTCSRMVVSRCGGVMRELPARRHGWHFHTSCPSKELNVWQVLHDEEMQGAWRFCRGITTNITSKIELYTHVMLGWLVMVLWSFKSCCIFARHPRKTKTAAIDSTWVLIKILERSCRSKLCLRWRTMRWTIAPR